MISIITITFNNYEELIETLTSIKEVKNIESIVINGGSCVKTRQFLETYNGISISEPDAGISDAFNKGIKLATGDAIMFLNSGDKLIDPTYLDDVNWSIANESSIDYFYSDIIYDDSTSGPTKISLANNKTKLSRGMPYPHQTLIIRKRVFDKIGNFKLKLKIAMDFDLVLRMINAGFNQKKYIAKTSVLMDGTGVSSKQELNCLKETRQILKENNQLTIWNSFRSYITLALFYLKKNEKLKIILKKYRHKIRI